MASSARTYVYLGTVDDMVRKYPWRFQITRSHFEYSLICNLLLDRQTLLNDGYIVQNPIVRQAIQSPNHLLRAMIRHGSLSVTSRGYRFRGVDHPPERRFGLHEMPERMTKIASMKALTEGRAKGVPDWPALRRELEAVDGEIARDEGYLSWSPYETGSGYEAFVTKLIEEKTTAASAGLDRLMTDGQFQGFLNTYRDSLRARPQSGPRDLWETVAQTFSEDVDVTNQPKQLLNGLMRLGNEIYHYNFSVGLAAAYEVPVSVETQPSQAFDDLLLSPTLFLKRVENLPAPVIPRGIVNVPADRLLGELAGNARLNEARSGYLAAVAAVEAVTDPSAQSLAALRDARDAYGRQITRAYRQDLTRPVMDHLFGFAYAEAKSLAKSAAAGSVGSLIGAGTYWLTQDAATTAAATAAAGGAGWIGTAYLVYLAGERLKPVATRMYKIVAAEGSALTPALRRQSNRTVASLSQQRSPVSLQINRATAAPLAARMRLFDA